MAILGAVSILRHTGHLDQDDVWPVIVLIALGYPLVWGFLRRFTTGILPTARVRRTIAMPIRDIMDEFIYVGYRIEALNEDTVVLVRFSLRHAFGFMAIILAVWLVAFLAFDLQELQGPLSLLIAVGSFTAVYFYTIAGYGYERISFHQQGHSESSTCLVFVNAFMPSRVRAGIVSTDDHGDEAWYRKNPNWL